MSSSSGDGGGAYVSGTPVKRVPAAAARAPEVDLFASAVHGRAPAAELLPSRAPPPADAGVAGAGGATAQAALRAGQGLLLHRASSFSRIAGQREQLCPGAAAATALALPGSGLAQTPHIVRRTDVPFARAGSSPPPPSAARCEDADGGGSLPAYAAQAPGQKRAADADAAKPRKRARAASSGAVPQAGAAQPKVARAPRAGAARDNFVRLQLGKNKRFKNGAGGRKFVTGASKPPSRSRKPSRSRTQLPDSTADAAPLIDDGFGALKLPSRSSAAAAPRPPPRAKPCMPPAFVPIIAAAQEEPNADKLSGADVLREVFGYPSFRAGQLQVVEHILAGRSCMAILPTGQGKSLCYQLAGLLLPGVTLVVSPLVALMDDQLTHLPAALPGAVLHSGQQPEEAAATLDALRAGALKVLFVAPERLLSRRFLDLAASLPANARFTFACVDECHCVSEWSHNFRPAYYSLGRVLRADLGISRVLALTATATRRTEAAVADALSIPEAHIVRAACMRDNLRLTVSREAKRDAALLALLRPGGRLEHVKSAIAYTSYKSDADRLAAFLFTNGVTAMSYHAGKTAADRSKAQALFLGNRVRVVVATVAFGMGLDKSDVGAVVNVGMPRSIEAYVQQVGRAGRDGAVAQCHTFVDDEEFLRLRSLTFSDGVDAPELLRLVGHIFPPAARAGACGCVVVHTAELDLGLRQEVIETVLSYLELGEGLPEQAPMISALPEMRATIHLSFHKTSAEELAEANPLVAQVLKLGKERTGRHAVSIPRLAAALDISFASLQEQLRELAAAGEVSYTSSDRALCFEILRPPSDAAALAAALASRLAAAEQCQVGKLDTIYSAAAAAAESRDPTVQEGELRRRIAAYFEAVGGTECLPPPQLVKQTSQHLLGDIRALLRQSRDVLTSSRLVARVLHGLSSPHISADTWRRNPAWGKHAAVDFDAVQRAADTELAALRRAP